MMFFSDNIELSKYRQFDEDNYRVSQQKYAVTPHTAISARWFYEGS